MKASHRFRATCFIASILALIIGLGTSLYLTTLLPLLGTSIYLIIILSWLVGMISMYFYGREEGFQLATDLCDIDRFAGIRFKR